jgi:phage terminase large subunit-like protein
VAYNPGRASKLERLHMVSHLFANGMVWVVESDKRPGQPRSWADPLIEQLCSFSGEKSIAHDDLVDSSTQALRVIVDKMGVSVANPREIDEYWQPSRRRGNPYAA